MFYSQESKIYSHYDASMLTLRLKADTGYRDVAKEYQVRLQVADYPAMSFFCM